MKTIFTILTLLFSLQLFAQTDSCITDKVTVAMATNADSFPGGAIDNSFDFTRINDKMIHAVAAMYYFPDFENRVETILEKTGNLTDSPATRI